jgi:hypothetical protein
MAGFGQVSTPAAHPAIADKNVRTTKMSNTRQNRCSQASRLNSQADMNVCST